MFFTKLKFYKCFHFFFSFSFQDVNLFGYLFAGIKTIYTLGYSQFLSFRWAHCYKL